MNVYEKLKSKFTTKQWSLIQKVKNENPRVCILSGGKRAGKTFSMVFLFLAEARKHKGKQFIIIGSSTGAVKRNIISELENYLGTTISLGKNNEFKLFGNTCTVFQGANSDCWKAIRGMTSHLTMINEATAQHPETIREAFDRTSGEGAKVLADTNTENPYHPFKVQYIDKNGLVDADGRLQILVENFTLFDNEFLSNDYINMQKAVYTEGSTDYLRDIMGVWVGREGVVYDMFRKERHILTNIPVDEGITRYFAGVDWGYEHHGSIVVVAKTTRGRFIVVEEVASQHKDINWWTAQAKDLRARYGIAMFYCDTARPEYVQAFNQAGLVATNANKAVIEGITYVASLLQADRLVILENRAPKLVEEMYQYIWKGGSKEEPVKLNDDCQDSLRYALFTEDKVNTVNTMYAGFTGPNKYSTTRFDPLGTQQKRR
ncbi:MAG: PBSX family phage terminase large subunit [Fusobacteriaceae bacterium]